MRGLGAVILSALIAGFVAGTVQIQLAIWYGSREEFIAAELGLMLLVLAAAVVYGVALAARAGRRVVLHLAIGFAGLVVVSLGAVEAVGFSQAGLAALRTDLPVLVELVVPAAIAILIQWWFVRRHLVKAGR